MFIDACCYTVQLIRCHRESCSSWQELSSLEDNQNYFVHTTRGHCRPSNICLYYLDTQTEEYLNIGCRLPLEVVDEPKCLKAKSEGKRKNSEEQN